MSFAIQTRSGGIYPRTTASRVMLAEIGGEVYPIRTTVSVYERCLSGHQTVLETAQPRRSGYNAQNDVRAYVHRKGQVLQSLVGPLKRDQLLSIIEVHPELRDDEHFGTVLAQHRGAERGTRSKTARQVLAVMLALALRGRSLTSCSPGRPPAIA